MQGIRLPTHQAKKEILTTALEYENVCYKTFHNKCHFAWAPTFVRNILSMFLLPGSQPKNICAVNTAFSWA